MQGDAVLGGRCKPWATNAFRCYSDVPKETGPWHLPVARRQEGATRNTGVLGETWLGASEPGSGK